MAKELATFAGGGVVVHNQRWDPELSKDIIEYIETHSDFRKFVRTVPTQSYVINLPRKWHAGIAVEVVEGSEIPKARDVYDAISINLRQNGTGINATGDNNKISGTNINNTNGTGLTVNGNNNTIENTTANNINGLYPNIKKPTDFFTTKSLYPQIKKKEYDDSQLDEVCIMKLKELKEALDFTIKIENYDESKKVTDFIQLVRKIGEKINDAKETKDKALDVNDWDTCKIAKNTIDNLREKVRAIDVGYLGFRKEEEEPGVVDVGTEPIEEEKDNVIQEDIAVKDSEIGDENESIREMIRYNA